MMDSKNEKVPVLSKSALKMLFTFGYISLALSFSMVYLIPPYLRWQGMDAYFLNISQPYTLGFFYKHDVLVNAVFKLYIIFIFPFIEITVISIMVFFEL